MKKQRIFSLFLIIFILSLIFIAKANRVFACSTSGDCPPGQSCTVDSSGAQPVWNCTGGGTPPGFSTCFTCAYSGGGGYCSTFQANGCAGNCDACPGGGPPVGSNVSGSITASPNPCLIAEGQSLCSSSISWTSANTAPSVYVCVSSGGSTEQLFASSGPGDTSGIAPWIGSTPATFRLTTSYDVNASPKCGGVELGRVDVAGTTASITYLRNSDPTQPITACNMYDNETTCHFGVRYNYNPSPAGGTVLCWGTGVPSADVSGSIYTFDPGYGPGTQTFTVRSPIQPVAGTYACTNNSGTLLATKSITINPKPSAPTVSGNPGCLSTPNAGTEYTASWSNTATPPITHVDISTSSTFSSYYSKAVTGINPPNINVPTSFAGLTLAPSTTYYLRVWNGYSHNVAPNGSFTTPTSCQGPNITSLQKQAGSTNTFAGANNVSGRQTTQSGSGWMNPLRITLNATKGTGNLKFYAAAFYDKARGLIYEQPALTSLTEIESQIDADSIRGFILAYASLACANQTSNCPVDNKGTAFAAGNYYAYVRGLGWVNISSYSPSNYYAILDRYNTPTPILKLTPISNGSNFATWQVLFDQTFGTKNMYSAGYVVDSLNLSRFTSDL